MSTRAEVERLNLAFFTVMGESVGSGRPFVRGYFQKQEFAQDFIDKRPDEKLHRTTGRGEAVIFPDGRIFLLGEEIMGEDPEVTQLRAQAEREAKAHAEKVRLLDSALSKLTEAEKEALKEAFGYGKKNS